MSVARQTLVATWVAVGVAVAGVLATVLVGEQTNWFQAASSKGTDKTPVATPETLAIATPYAAPTCAALPSPTAGTESIDAWQMQGDSCWHRVAPTLDPGKPVLLEIRYTNNSPTSQYNVTIRMQLPTGVRIVPGSEVLKNSSNPNWTGLYNSFAIEGINIGNYSAGSNAFVKMSLVIPAGPTDCQSKAVSVPITLSSTDSTGQASDAESTAIFAVPHNCTG